MLDTRGQWHILLNYGQNSSTPQFIHTGCLTMVQYKHTYEVLKTYTSFYIFFDFCSQLCSTPFCLYYYHKMSKSRSLPSLEDLKVKFEESKKNEIDKNALIEVPQAPFPLTNFSLN